MDEADRGVLAFEAELAPTAPLVTEEGSHEEVEHRRGEADVAGQVPADAPGEGQRPLAERHVGQHSLHLKRMVGTSRVSSAFPQREDQGRR